MKIKMVLSGEPDSDACAQYRQQLPALTLQRQGVDIEIVKVLDGVLWEDEMTPYGVDPRVRDWEPEADIVIFSRPARRNIADLIEIAATKACVVVDLDDDFYNIPRENKAWPIFNPEISPLRNSDHIRRAVAAAHVVTVTTDALARRYGKGKTKVLPNCVPAAYLDIDIPHDFQPRVGWTGTMQTHPHDLESTNGAIGRTLRANPEWDFYVVGDGAGVHRALELHMLSRVVTTGWVPFADYAHAMAATDIGIVPLHVSPFNQGKSYLKGLEYAALGVPFVASSTGPYEGLAGYGVGQIARHVSDWKPMLERLMNHDYRQEVAETTREIVRQRFTVEANATRWLDVWMDALADRQLSAVRYP